jgi:transcriptional regulator with PAS, ATPase and Fis domain
MDMDLIFGQSPLFSALVGTADRYARSPWPVLLLGETGVGKELLARRIHRESRRALCPFIPVNCGALPPGLFESEVFGYERGAFSGASQNSRGILRSAHGGTVFLDEIGDLEPSLQVKLLRWLDSGEVRAVGATRIDQVDVRLVAATNADLYKGVREGWFRQDLLERLSVLTLRIPPLRERPEDIPGLAMHVLKTLDVSFSDEIFAALKGFFWPGNVRQLRNVLVRASLMGGDRIVEKHLHKLLREEEAWAQAMAPVSRRDLNDGSLAEIEKTVIVERLKKCHGNRKRTAKELGIAKSTLHEKLRRWKEEEEAPRFAVSRGGPDLLP